MGENVIDTYGFGECLQGFDGRKMEPSPRSLLFKISLFALSVLGIGGGIVSCFYWGALPALCFTGAGTMSGVLLILHHFFSSRDKESAATPLSVKISSSPEATWNEDLSTGDESDLGVLDQGVPVVEKVVAPARPSLMEMIQDPSNRLENIQNAIANGADVNVANGEGDTPLHLITQSLKDPQDDEVEIVRALLGAGADPQVKNHAGIKPAYTAAYYKSVEIMAMLNEAATSQRDASEFEGSGLSDPVQDPVLDTPPTLDETIKNAALKGSLVEVKNLIELGFDPTLMVDGKGLLYFAIQSLNLELIKYLINDKKLDPEKVDEDLNSALHILLHEKGQSKDIKQKVLSIAEYLIDEKKIPVVRQNAKKQTPLILAALNQRTEVQELIIRNSKGFI